MMINSKLNIILFDDEEPSRSRVSNGEQFTSNNPQPDLQKQIIEINKKLLQLEIQQQVLKQKVHSLVTRKRELESNTTTAADKTRNGSDQSYAQQILMLADLKIQMLIKETNNILQQMKQRVEDVLTKQLADRTFKNTELKELSSKIQKMYEQKVAGLHRYYQNEIAQISNKNLAIQADFQRRVQTLESKCHNRMNNLERECQRYQQTIKQLRMELTNRQDTYSQVLTTVPTQRDLQPTPTHSNNHQRPTDKSKKKENDISDREKENRCSRIRKPIFDNKRGDNKSRSISPIKTVYSDMASMKMLEMQFQQFQDLKDNHHQNHHDVSSDEDVFFYPETLQNQHNYLSNTSNNNNNPNNILHSNTQNNNNILGLDIQSKVFSPFDIN